MKSITLSLNSIEKVKKFVNIIGRYDGDFDLSSGRYKVDAKSIMGIFSLDLSSPLKLDIHNDELAEEVIAEIQNYIEQQ
ncbi:HPr family phosphocarrier protein [Defluviitalea saccharophila]|uniref:HPr family phosphocarrier protein n=1 Tax=Defluviitalea saccharophila TaxID=879970 RepID=A0ABZ2Y904_9FIRM|nr:HPr family phosphocarrier protein [Candidatus Epulonipiscium sp.]